MTLVDQPPVSSKRQVQHCSGIRVVCCYPICGTATLLAEASVINPLDTAELCRHYMHLLLLLPLFQGSGCVLYKGVKVLSRQDPQVYIALSPDKTEVAQLLNFAAAALLADLVLESLNGIQPDTSYNFTRDDREWVSRQWRWVAPAVDENVKSLVWFTCAWLLRSG